MKNNKRTKKCPYCAEEIQEDAVKCKHCGEFLNQKTKGLKNDSKMESQTEKSEKKFYMRWWFWVLIFFGFCAVLNISSYLSGTQQTQTAVPATSPITVQNSTKQNQSNLSENSQTKSVPATTSVNQQATSSPESASSQTKTIPGLTSINASGTWANWSSSADKDGIEFPIAFLDNIGKPIYLPEYNVNINLAPISIDVKLYTSNGDYPPLKVRLVYSGSFTNDQIIRGLSPWPEVRVPKEQINVNPQVDDEFGIAVVTLHTPEQGDFSFEDDFVQLYYPTN